MTDQKSERVVNVHGLKLWVMKSPPTPRGVTAMEILRPRFGLPSSEGRVAVLEKVNTSKALRVADASGNVDCKGLSAQSQSKWQLHWVPSSGLSPVTTGAGTSAAPPIMVRLQNGHYPQRYLRLDNLRKVSAGQNGGRQKRLECVGVWVWVWVWVWVCVSVCLCVRLLLRLLLPFVLLKVCVASGCRVLAVHRSRSRGRHRHSRVRLVVTVQVQQNAPGGRRRRLYEGPGHVAHALQTHLQILDHFCPVALFAVCTPEDPPL